MSMESAQAFWKYLQDNQDVARQLSEAKSEEQVRAIIAAAGDYDFSPAELHEVIRAQTGAKLSDQELDGVAGGGADNIIWEKIPLILPTGLKRVANPFLPGGQ